jgi:acetyltransferase-like isoleucine patch superfamily enzyme
LLNAPRHMGRVPDKFTARESIRKSGEGPWQGEFEGNVVNRYHNLNAESPRCRHLEVCKRYEPLSLPPLLGRLVGKIAFAAPGGYRLRPWLHRLRGVAIGSNVWISQFVYIDELHPTDVAIGDNCTIGLRTSIFTHFYWGPRRPTGNGKVIIERDVFIGPHCVILPNVRIGEGAVIRAGTVVSRNVPPHTFWGSPPAEALGLATVPLTPQHPYEEFVDGLKMRLRR